MGIPGRQICATDRFGESAYLVIRPCDREHDHVHLLASRLDPMGRAVSDQCDRYKVLRRTVPHDWTGLPSACGYIAERLPPAVHIGIILLVE